jgi:hypothetical protein
VDDDWLGSTLVIGVAVPHNITEAAQRKGRKARGPREEQKATNAPEPRMMPKGLQENMDEED